jgi:hypothetical protein
MGGGEWKIVERVLHEKVVGSYAERNLETQLNSAQELPRGQALPRTPGTSRVSRDLKFRSEYQPAIFPQSLLPLFLPRFDTRA